MGGTHFRGIFDVFASIYDSNHPINFLKFHTGNRINILSITWRKPYVPEKYVFTVKQGPDSCLRRRRRKRGNLYAQNTFTIFLRLNHFWIFWCVFTLCQQLCCLFVCFGHFLPRKRIGGSKVPIKVAVMGMSRG